MTDKRLKRCGYNESCFTNKKEVFGISSFCLCDHTENKENLKNRKKLVICGLTGEEVDYYFSDDGLKG